MSYSNFTGIQYFKPTGTIDKWGDASRINRDLLTELDRFRHHLGIPVYITSGFRNGSGTSQHDHGNAVDIVVPGYQKTLFDLYLEAERFGFTGIGLYPDWKWNGDEIGGLHLDVRSAVKGARWLGKRNQDSGMNQYFSMTKFNLQALGII